MELIEIYSVTAKSPDDGHRLSYGYYCNHDNAESARSEFPEYMHAQICVHEAVKLDAERVFMIPTDFLELSDEKRQALNKLTGSERKALGV